MKFYPIILVLVIMFFLNTCSKHATQDDLPLKVASTPLFNGYVNYLILTESYVRVFETQDISSSVLHIIRKGDILTLLNTAQEDEFGFGWYQISLDNIRGWIFTYRPYLTYSFDHALLLQNILLQEHRP